MVSYKRVLNLIDQGQYKEANHPSTKGSYSLESPEVESENCILIEGEDEGIAFHPVGTAQLAYDTINESIS